MKQFDFINFLRNGKIEQALSAAALVLRDGGDVKSKYAAHLCFAHVAAAEQDWETAEKALRAAIMLDDDTVEAPLVWAQVQLDQGHIEKALRSLRQLDSKRARQHADWYKIQARLATGAGQPQKSVEFLQKAQALDPENRALPLLLATSMAEAGQIQEAADYMLQRCAQDPEDAAQWRVAASLQSSARGPGEAFKVLLEASRHCEDPGILQQLLSAAAVNNAFSEVREAIDKIKQLSKKNPDLRRSLATFYLAAGKVDQALHQFEKAFRQNPDVPDLRRSYAAALLRKAQKAKGAELQDLRNHAQELLEESLCQVDEESGWRVYNDLAALLLSGDQNDRQRAATLLDMLIDKEQFNEAVLLNRAVLFAMSGAYKDARKLARRVRKDAEEGSLAARQADQLIEELKSIKSNS